MTDLIRMSAEQMRRKGLENAELKRQREKDYNMKIMLGCMIETSAAISAMYQISGEADFLDLDGNLLIENDPFKGVIVENGVLKGSLNPGIGAVLKNKYKRLLK